MDARPVVALFRHELLAASETFIRAQADALVGFAPIFVGLRRIDGLALPDDQTFVLETPAVASRLASLRLQLGTPDRRFVRRIRARRPALVHAHFEGGGILAAPLARALGVPLLVTCHGFDVTMDDQARFPNAAVRAFYRRRRRQLQRSDACYVAVSEHIRRAMLARGYPDARIRVLRIGVDAEALRPDPAIAREPIVLFVGRLVEKKGAEYLIRAMPAVTAAVPAARAVLIGDGPLRADLERLGRQVRAPIELLGTRPYADVVRLMRQARVLCVPTNRAANGDMDGCAMVLVEAQAAGLPVVSFESGGTPEAVISGKTGWLSAERDVAGLARGITALLTDERMWGAFSAAAARHVGEHFDLRVQTARLEDCYRELATRT